MTTTNEKLRANINNVSYLNIPFFNTGSVSGTQYTKETHNVSDPLEKAIVNMDKSLSEAYNKFQKYLIK